MRAIKRNLKVAVSAAVAMSLFSAFTEVDESAAFQSLRSTSQGSGETCALSIEMLKKGFRMQYMQKVARYQDGAVDDRLSSVEEMYGNVQQASFFSDEADDAMVNSAGVDPLSLDCLGCHDGSRASDVTINLKNDPYKRLRGDAEKDHPIGMDYSAYVARNIGYKPIIGKSKMVLVDGKVGCLTCHDPMNQERGHLVMSDRNSAPCLTCHSK